MRTNCPKSWHNSHIVTEIYKKLDLETPEGFSLIADSAFLQDSCRLEGKTLMSLYQGDPLLLDRDEHQFVFTQSCTLILYCQTAEWGMQQL